MHRCQGKSIVTGPKLVLATLTVIVAVAVAGGIAFAGLTSAAVNESASLRLISTGIIRSPVQAFARLQLHIGEQDGASFRARARVESDGLIRNRLYTMWLDGPEGKTLLIDTARADEECEEDQDTGEEEEDCEVVVDLRAHLTQAPFNITTLVGLTINIREHSNPGLFSNDAPVVATGTVTRSDLVSFNLASRPPNIGINIGNPFGDLPAPPATMRSSSRPPVVGTNMGSPFDGEKRRREKEDEERRLEEEEEEQ